MDDNPVAEARPKVYRDLPCQLVRSELIERGEQLALLQGEIESVEAAKKEDNAMWNAKTKAARARMEKLGKEIREKQEIREVEVRETLHADIGKALTIRVDTGENIRERAMTEDEKQRSLFERGPVDADGGESMAGSAD
jgi:hypothetical protein